MIKIGRNQPCPCGSGRKYKHCCSNDGSGASSPHTNGQAHGHFSPGVHIPPEAIAGHDWQADIIPLPISFESDPLARPTALLVTANELILAQETSFAPLGEFDEIAAKLAKAIDAARRATGVTPPAVVVRWEEIADELRARVPANLPVRATPFLEDLEACARELLVSVAEFPHWPPVSNPDSWLAWGLPRPLITELFDAAADFRRAQPWRILDGVPPLIVRLPGGRAWTAAVMGSGGEEFGVTIYAEFGDYVRTITATHREDVATFFIDRTLALAYGDRSEVSARVQREVASNRWRLAAPDAYPMLLALNTPAGGISRQDARDLIAVLRAVRAFVDEKGQLFEADRVPASVAMHDASTGATVLYDTEFPWIDSDGIALDDEIEFDDLVDEDFISADDLPDLNEFGDAAQWLRSVLGFRLRRTPRGDRPRGRSSAHTGRALPPKGSAEAVAAVLEHAFAWITAYARQDPAATGVITEGAKHMLREYAHLEPGEISRVLKPEAWAAGALHAGFQLGSTAVRSAAQLARSFRVSSSAVNVRSRSLREAVEWPGETPSREDHRPLSLWPESEAEAQQVTGSSSEAHLGDAKKDPDRVPEDLPTEQRESDVVSENVAPEAAGAVVLPFARRGATADDRRGRARTIAHAASASRSTGATPDFTPLQGQYLTFIHYYTKLHRRPPSEVDLRDYFRVTAPSVHNMILTLERKGLISRVPRQPRSIRVLVPKEALPELE